MFSPIRVQRDVITIPPNIGQDSSGVLQEAAKSPKKESKVSKDERSPPSGRLPFPLDTITPLTQLLPAGEQKLDRKRRRQLLQSFLRRCVQVAAQDANHTDHSLKGEGHR